MREQNETALPEQPPMSIFGTLVIVSVAGFFLWGCWYSALQMFSDIYVDLGGTLE